MSFINPDRNFKDILSHWLPSDTSSHSSKSESPKKQRWVISKDNKETSVKWIEISSEDAPKLKNKALLNVFQQMKNELAQIREIRSRDFKENQEIIEMLGQLAERVKEKREGYNKAHKSWWYKVASAIFTGTFSSVDNLAKSVEKRIETIETTYKTEQQQYEKLSAEFGYSDAYNPLINNDHFEALCALYKNLCKKDLHPNIVDRIAQVEHMREEISKVKGYEILSLDGSNWNFEVIPNEIGLIQGLKGLQINRIQMNHIPNWIGSIRTLESLTVTHCGLKEIPKEIGQLTQLKKLDLSNNRLQPPPKDIRNLGSLERLMLSNNDFKEFPKEVGLLPSLIEFDCLEELETHLGYSDQYNPFRNNEHYRALRALYENLSGIKLDVDGQFKQLNRIGQVLHFREVISSTNLSALTLDSNNEGFTVIPIEISLIQELKGLQINGIQIDHIPQWICSMHSLESLAIVNCSLITLPKEIGQLSQLHQLIACNNHIAHLPKEIGDLKALKELDLSNNQLTELPSEIYELHNLRELDLHNNRLTKLPEEMSRLSSLKGLDLTNNPLTHLPEHLVGLGQEPVIGFHLSPPSSLRNTVDTIEGFNIIFDTLDNRLHQLLPSLINQEFELGSLLSSIKDDKGFGVEHTLARAKEAITQLKTNPQLLRNTQDSIIKCQILINDVLQAMEESKGLNSLAITQLYEYLIEPLLVRIKSLQDTWNMISALLRSAILKDFEHRIEEISIYRSRPVFPFLKSEVSDSLSIELLIEAQNCIDTIHQISQEESSTINSLFQKLPSIYSSSSFALDPTIRSKLNERLTYLEDLPQYTEFVKEKNTLLKSYELELEEYVDTLTDRFRKSIKDLQYEPEHIGFLVDIQKHLEHIKNNLIYLKQHAQYQHNKLQKEVLPPLELVQSEIKNVALLRKKHHINPSKGSSDIIQIEQSAEYLEQVIQGFESKLMKISEQQTVIAATIHSEINIQAEAKLKEWQTSFTRLNTMITKLKASSTFLSYPELFVNPLIQAIEMDQYFTETLLKETDRSNNLLISPFEKAINHNFEQTLLIFKKTIDTYRTNIVKFLNNSDTANTDELCLLTQYIDYLIPNLGKLQASLQDLQVKLQQRIGDKNPKSTSRWFQLPSWLGFEARVSKEEELMKFLAQEQEILKTTLDELNKASRNTTLELSRLLSNRNLEEEEVSSIREMIQTIGDSGALLPGHIENTKLDQLKDWLEKLLRAHVLLSKANYQSNSSTQELNKILEEVAQVIYAHLINTGLIPPLISSIEEEYSKDIWMCATRYLADTKLET